MTAPNPWRSPPDRPITPPAGHVHQFNALYFRCLDCGAPLPKLTRPELVP